MPLSDNAAMSPQLLTAQDMEKRYGQLIPLAALTEYLNTTTRALRPLLRERGVEPIEVGKQELVQIREIEAALGLTTVEALVGQMEAQTARNRMNRLPDGRVKTVDELYAEIQRDAPARRAALGAKSR
jgi:hypothetical protein